MSRRSKLTTQQGFMPPTGLAPVAIPQLTPIDAELERLASLAQQDSYIYSPVIMNTVLTMLLLFKMSNNLLLPLTVPYGGYQITYDGTHNIEESDSDIEENDKVNNAIFEHINKGKTRFAVSLFLHYPLDPTVNHANMLLFEYNKDENKLTVFHYEPYGNIWGDLFPRIAVIEKILLKTIIERIKRIDHEFNPEIIVNQQLPTIINQAHINAIQGITEGGYCQMISLLQAYLFLKYGQKTTFTPDGETPLGRVIGQGSPRASGGRLPEFQLNVIRGFVIYIGQLINNFFSPIGINISIDTLSRIQHLYEQQPGAPPIYLFYIDALVKYVAGKTQTDGIISPDIMSVIDESKSRFDASKLTSLEDRAMKLLKRLPNHEFDLLDYEKQRIITAYATRAAADARAAATTRGAINTDPLTKRVISKPDVSVGKAKSSKRVMKGGKIKTKKNKKKRRQTKKQREKQRK